MVDCEPAVDERSSHRASQPPHEATILHPTAAAAVGAPVLWPSTWASIVKRTLLAPRGVRPVEPETVNRYRPRAVGNRLPDLARDANERLGGDAERDANERLGWRRWRSPLAALSFEFRAS